MTIVEIVVQFHLFFAETVLLSSFSFSVCRINISFLECMLVYFYRRRWIRKDLQSTAELFHGVLLDNIHSQNLPNIKTYGMTKPTRKFVILYQSQNRRQVLYFSLENSPISESGVEGEGEHLHTHHSSILTKEKRQMKKQPSDTRAWHDYYDNRT